MDDEILSKAKEVIETWSQKKLAYETKRAKAKGFTSTEEYVASKLAPAIKLPKTKSEINPDWKKTDPDGSPFFDLRVFAKPKPDRSPTKEMFEWWLLDIGSKDPSEFPELKDGMSMRKSTSGIHACTMFFDGGIFLPKKSKYDSKWASIWFKELQHLVTNDRMFWLLFAKFYVSDERSLNKDELSKPNRLSVPLFDRMRVHQSSLMVNGENWSKGGLSSDFQNKRISEFDDEDYLTVYRAFSVQAKRRDENGKLVRGKPVRKGITKLSEEGGIHMEGNGYSYSFSKIAALRLAYNVNTHIIKKHCEVDDKKASKILETWVSDRLLEYVEMYDGFYRALGIFKVKKRNVLFCTDARSEDELIANPKDVILVDYKFLNSMHFMAMIMSVSLGQTASGDKLMSVANLDDVFDCIYEWVRITEKEKTGLISRFLRQHFTSTGEKDFLGEFQTYLKKGLGVAKDSEHFLTIFGREDGRKEIGFFAHLIFPLKKSRNLYQPRKFGMSKVEAPISNQASRPRPTTLRNLPGFLAENKSSHRTWFNMNP